MKKVLIILTIIVSFGLAPFGYINVKTSQDKFDYEIAQAKAMFPDEPYRQDIENHYQRHIRIYGVIAIVGPVLGLTLLYRQRKQRP